MRLLTSTLAAVLALFAVFASRPATGLPAEILAIRGLEEALAEASCDMQCVYAVCQAGEHAITGSGGEEDEIPALGPAHSCGHPMGLCKDHACTTAMQLNLEILHDLVPSLDSESIRDLVADSDQAVVNPDRGALQVLGCGGAALLSIPLRSDQLPATT